MKKLVINDINQDTYSLIDVKDNKSYSLSLTFYDIDNVPTKGDIIRIADELLDTSYEEYSNSYQFGALDKPYGRNIKSSVDIDCIMLQQGNKKTYLKRFFG